jgi:hypothetical protein
VEITGTEDKIQAFEGMVRPFGLIELIRTGEIAVARGRSITSPKATFAPTVLPRGAYTPLKQDSRPNFAML